MTPLESELIKRLANSVEKLERRIDDMDATINKGRGAYLTFLLLISVIGTGLGIWKYFSK